MTGNFGPRSEKWKAMMRERAAEFRALGSGNFRHGGGSNKSGRRKPEYNSWRAMKGRCLNPKYKKWPSYGGRGITVCERWQHSFADFLLDMGTKPGPEYSLGRINNDGNYEPSNCRWETPKEQANNQRPRRKRIIRLILGFRQAIILAILAICVLPSRGQTPTNLMPTPRQQFFNAAGQPLSGGCIWTYISGTSTPLATYSDYTGSILNSNPVILDSGGFATIWLQSSNAYTITVFSSGGTNCALGQQQWSVNGITGSTNLLAPGPIGTLVPNIVEATEFLSNATFPALSGLVRLGSSDSICWRNNSNTGDICIYENTNNSIVIPTLDNIPIIGTTQYPATSVGVQAAVDYVVPGGTIQCLPGTAIPLSTTVNINKDVYIQGFGGSSRSLMSTPSCSMIAPIGGAVFTLSGTVRNFGLKNLTFHGNGAGSFLFSFATAPTVSAEGNVEVSDSFIQGFGSTAITVGSATEPTYIVKVHDNNFSDNCGDIAQGPDSDILIYHNFFNAYNPSVMCSTPRILLQGSDSHVYENQFVSNAVLGFFSGNDIQMADNFASDPIGNVEIGPGNKFGSEGESPTRVKIAATGSRNPAYVQEVNIHDNWVSGYGNGGTIAIQMISPMIPAGWIIQGNIFQNITTVIDDQSMVPAAGYLGNIFGVNEIFNAPGFRGSVFTHGGRYFTSVSAPFGVPDQDQPVAPRNNETVFLTNRLPNSENFGATWTLTDVTATAGQTDPYGTTRATQLAVTTPVSGANAGSPISQTSETPNFVVSFWAKAGTCSTVQLSLNDQTNSGIQIGPFGTLSLSTSWKRYKLYANGMPNNTDLYALDLYPCFPATSGNVYVFGIQVSDVDSDYIATSGSAIVNQAGGNRFEQPVVFANSTTPFSVTGTGPFPFPNLITLPTIYSVSGALRTTAHLVYDTFTLTGGTGSTTLTGSAIFPTSYNCYTYDSTTPANSSYTAISGNTITFHGTGTDVLTYGCIGY